MKTDNDQLLENFMKEFFPFKEFKEAGVFTNEMRGDYKAQAERICNRLVLKSIYEYGKDEIKCHISYGDGALDSRTPISVDEHGEMKSDFIKVVPSIYES